MFFNEGGISTPLITEKLKPWAWPGPWYGSCPKITAFVVSKGVELRALNIEIPTLVEQKTEGCYKHL